MGRQTPLGVRSAERPRSRDADNHLRYKPEKCLLRLGALSFQLEAGSSLGGRADWIMRLITNLD